MSEIALPSLLLVLALMHLLWLASIAKRDASIVDPFWGTGFVILSWFAFFRSQTELPLRVHGIVWLTTLWGLRLSLHLLLRNAGHGEDKRYRAMREFHGPRFWWVSLLTVFWLQAIILWLVSFPVLATVQAAEQIPLRWLDGIGAAVWLTGLFFEAVGDFQMARFQSRPENRGLVMDRGLWRYTRHPNYFGDFCIWWGLYLIAASGGAPWTIFSPLLMSVLLLKVSGVTLLEKTMTVRRPAYADYQRRTNAFFPGPPGKPSGS
jgi:steroid 5-alpha reductase family enzyme